MLSTVEVKRADLSVRPTHPIYACAVKRVVQINYTRVIAQEAPSKSPSKGETLNVFESPLLWRGLGEASYLTAMTHLYLTQCKHPLCAAGVERVGKRSDAGVSLNAIQSIIN